MNANDDRQFQAVCELRGVRHVWAETRYAREDGVPDGAWSEASGGEGGTPLYRSEADDLVIRCKEYTPSIRVELHPWADVRVDGNGNRIIVQSTDTTHDGKPLVAVWLADDLTRGYLALDEGTGGFGNEACPSSYGMPCMTWFGPGERYPDADEAIDAIADEEPRLCDYCLVGRGSCCSCV